jgi:hypothetical protein
MATRRGMPRQDARTLSAMRSAWLSVILVVAVAVVVLVPNSPASRVPSEDAGVFFYAARELLSGGTPYLNVWDHKPPLIYLIDAVGLAIAGPAGVWLMQILALAGAALLSLRAMARAFGLLPATFGTLAWLVASPRLFLKDEQQTSYVEFFVLPLQLASLAIVAARPDLRFARREALGLGALAALALLLKPTLVGVWIAIAVVALWRERTRALPAVMFMAIGGTAVLALFAAFFVARGALSDLLEQALRYNLAYAAFAPFVERLGAIPEGLRLISPSGLAPLALTAAAWAVVRRNMAPAVLAVALVALPLELLLATSGRAYHYYFLPWLAVMGVLAAYAASEVLRRIDGRRALVLIAAVVVLMSIQPARLVTRLAATPDDGSSRAAAAAIVARTLPSDRVLIWGARAEVLVLADRRSATRFIYQYAPLATRGYSTPAAIDAFLQELERDRPALIVDASTASFVTPPLDRDGLRTWVSPEPQYAWPSETLRILSYVETSYVRDGAIAGVGWSIWRRR